MQFAGNNVVTQPLTYTVGGLVCVWVFFGPKPIIALLTLQVTKSPLIQKLHLLNFWHITNIPSIYKDLISLVYAAARLTIAHCWKRSSPSQIMQWHAKIMDLFIMSKVSDQVLHTTRDEDGCIQPLWKEAFFKKIAFTILFHLLG